MNPNMEEEVNVDLVVQSILLAAANHDTSALRSLLRNGSSNVQDPETGLTPLHAAVAACEPQDDHHVNGTNEHANGYGDDKELPGEVETAALKTVKLLFQCGAIWNDIDKDGETPGCVAHRLGLMSVYEAIVDAGVRAELLLNRLDSYQPLADGDEDEGDDEERKKEKEEEGGGARPAQDAILGDAEGSTIGGTSANVTANNGETLSEEADSSNRPDNVRDKEEKAEYLSSDLTIYPTRVLDSDNNAVMMDWETEIMKQSVKTLLPRRHLRILNVGHGMGIIDNFFQAEQPSAHHIIEAHPAVLAKMRENGWYEKQNVRVHEGKWQDVMPTLIEQGIYFDAIYYDTFGESYKDLRKFFSEYVVELLHPEQNEVGNNDNDDSREDAGARRGAEERVDHKTKFGFFNGLGADRQVCYDVYTKVHSLLRALLIYIVHSIKY